MELRSRGEPQIYGTHLDDLRRIDKEGICRGNVATEYASTNQVKYSCIKVDKSKPVL